MNLFPTETVSPEGSSNLRLGLGKSKNVDRKPQVIYQNQLCVLATGGSRDWHRCWLEAVQVTIDFRCEQTKAAVENTGRGQHVSAKTSSFQPTVTSVGMILAPRSITLRNEIAGQVVSVPLQSGQIVEKGNVLLLDRRVEEAELLSAQTRQRMVNSMLDRTRKSATANASSGDDADQAEAEMAQVDAG